MLSLIHISLDGAVEHGRARRFDAHRRYALGEEVAAVLEPEELDGLPRGGLAGREQVHALAVGALVVARARGDVVARGAGAALLLHLLVEPLAEQPRLAPHGRLVLGQIEALAPARAQRPHVGRERRAVGEQARIVVCLLYTSRCV